MLSVEGRRSMVVNINCQPDGVKRHLGGVSGQAWGGAHLDCTYDVGRPILTV